MRLVQHVKQQPCSSSHAMLLSSANRIAKQAHFKHRVANMPQELGFSLIPERSECDISENLEDIWTLRSTNVTRWYKYAHQAFNQLPHRMQSTNPAH